jgi:hypothetical protein
MVGHGAEESRAVACRKVRGRIGSSERMSTQSGWPVMRGVPGDEHGELGDHAERR